MTEALFLIITNQTGLAGLPAVVPNLRQKVALERTIKATAKAIEGFRTEQSPELTAIEVKEALDALGEIVGETTPEDILDQIFSRFCIGK